MCFNSTPSKVGCLDQGMRPKEVSLFGKDNLPLINCSNKILLYISLPLFKLLFDSIII